MRILVPVRATAANVRAAEASYALAAAEVERQRQLFAQKFISASALDMHEAELKTASALLAQVKAQASITSNQAQYTQLRADRDGVVTYDYLQQTIGLTFYRTLHP